MYTLRPNNRSPVQLVLGVYLALALVACGGAVLPNMVIYDAYQELSLSVAGRGSVKLLNLKRARNEAPQ